MTVSMAAGPTPVTTEVIPSRSDSVFLKLVAEQVSSRARGIAIVSLFAAERLERETAKTLMTEILGMVES